MPAINSEIGIDDVTGIDIGTDPRGWGRRAEEAKGEGGEDGEDERTHYERLMIVWRVKRVV